MRLVVMCLFAGLLAACAPTAASTSPAFPSPTSGSAQLPASSAAFTLSSPDFEANAAIPVLYTCNGKNISPALAWNDPPAGTQSFALVVDDPDAPNGDWVHWILFNIPAQARSLPQAAPTDAQLSDGSLNGTTSFGKPGYGGPCPPSGTHHYIFTLYALDIRLDLKSNANKNDLLGALRTHILGHAELTGIY